jgi:hypothetical protein
MPVGAKPLKQPSNPPTRFARQRGDIVTSASLTLEDGDIVQDRDSTGAVERPGSAPALR